MHDIEINNAHLQYAEQVLFDKLSFTIKAQQWTCLLGASGVGKSTLLRLLAGLTAVGKNDILAADITNHDELKKNIAYMAQQDGLLPWLSALQNVVLGSKLRHQKPDYNQAKLLLEQVGLAAAENKNPEQLSGGMRQRVALARTLYENKSIVLMDEPFSALDVITRLKLQELAVTLLQNKTVLFITHDPLEALRVADNIYVMFGQPVKMSAVIQPQGKAPRDLNDQTILKLQGELLRELEVASCNEKLIC
jgi:putative hydroxymethylpyrimidine transport system ATP-binding protein